MTTEKDMGNTNKKMFDGKYNTTSPNNQKEQRYSDEEIYPRNPDIC